MLVHGFFEILEIQKFRRVVSYTAFYCFAAVLSYAYTSNTTTAGYSRADQFYASYPAGTGLLTEAAKALALNQRSGVQLSSASWLSTFDRQGKSPYAYHAQYMAHVLSHGQLDGSS